MSSTTSKDNTSTAEAQIDEARPQYRVRLRHINCSKYNVSGKSRGFCEFTTNWAPSPELSSDDCCGSASGDVNELNAERAAAQSLLKDLQSFAEGECGKFECMQGADIVDAHIVWNGAAPTTSHGWSQAIHSSAIKPKHLELFRERNAGDYIQVSFSTLYRDEDARRESMYKALGKLARRASSHCNR